MTVDTILSVVRLQRVNLIRVFVKPVNHKYSNNPWL